MISDARFYRQWILANGWAEALGLGTTFAIGGVLMPQLSGSPDPLTLIAGAIVAVLLGTLLEGVLVGVAQQHVIRKRLSEMRPRSWVTATAVGAGLAWCLGMVPSTVMALTSMDSGVNGAPEPSAPLQYAVAGLLGFAVGPILGLAQWTVLRRHVSHAGQWLWANALAWGLAMPLIFLGMDRIPWGSHPAVVLVVIYALCGAAGIAAGAVHGWTMIRLTRSRS